MWCSPGVFRCVGVAYLGGFLDALPDGSRFAQKTAQVEEFQVRRTGTGARSSGTSSRVFQSQTQQLEGLACKQPFIPLALALAEHPINSISIILFFLGAIKPYKKALNPFLMIFISFLSTILLLSAKLDKRSVILPKRLQSSDWLVRNRSAQFVIASQK